MWLLLLVAVSWSANQEAELIRLNDEVMRLAQQSSWSGVERKYRSMLALRGVTIAGPMHLLGAKAAFERGEVEVAYERAQVAATVDPADTDTILEASNWLADFEVNYGAVQIDVSMTFVGEPALTALDGASFTPKVRIAIDHVNKSLKDNRKYVGFVPLGRYQVGDTRFDIFGGPSVKVFVKPMKELPPSAATPAPVVNEPPPDRIVTLAVRRGGWTADTWEDAARVAREALYGIDGVMTVDAFQPTDPWLVYRPLPEKLAELSIEPPMLLSTLQAGLNVQTGMLSDDQATIAFPPGAADARALAAVVVVPAEVTSAGQTVREPVLAEQVGALAYESDGPFVVAADQNHPASYRIEVKVRGDSQAERALLPAVEALSPVAPLGLRLEEPARK